MNEPIALSVQDSLRLNAQDLTRSTIGVVRRMFAVSGVVAVVLGIALLVWPTKSVQVAAILLGIYFVCAALVRLAAAVGSRGLAAGWRVLDVFFSVLFLVGGIFMLRNSAQMGQALLIVVAFIVGIGWIAEGILALVESGASASEGWSIAFGVISLLAGITVVAVPSWSGVALVIFTGAALLVTGIVALVRAFTFGRSVLAAMDTTIEGTAVER